MYDFDIEGPTVQAVYELAQAIAATRSMDVVEELFEQYERGEIARSQLIETGGAAKSTRHFE